VKQEKRELQWAKQQAVRTGYGTRPGYNRPPYGTPDINSRVTAIGTVTRILNNRRIEVTDSNGRLYELTLSNNYNSRIRIGSHVRSSGVMSSASDVFNADVTFLGWR
jgi:hypothetical protein